MTIVKPLCTAAAVLLLAACSQPSVRPGDEAGAGAPEQLVEQRARERWDLLLEQDYTAAWEYLTPGYRSATPARTYANTLNRSPVRWLDAEVRSAECPEPQKCVANVWVKTKVAGTMRMVESMDVETTITEDWLLLDGQWYVVME